MYLIVVGAGDIGTPLVDLATAGGNEVVVIERDGERAERASRQYDCLVINDDATSKETLQDAGADRADALISTTDQDATNIMVCLLAQELSVPNIVSVVHNPEHMNVFEQIGVNTMQNPQSLIAEYLYRAVSRPSVVDFMHIGEEAEVFEISVGPDAPIAGKTLREADEADLIGGQTLIVAIERDGEGKPITPRGGTRIEADDLLTVYSGEGVTPELTDVFGHTGDGE
ncbi:MULTISPECIES: potassium channel family protein [Halorubrum]|uniref:Trk system potassium uptake protein TrkA n=2 Tax=Halorubrum TaxID=56688 RepID=A0A1I6GPL2_HALSD|nr:MULTISPECIES: TrkA family potassium uptake protein [Halorubrum]TKX55223.1 TrkA family potassium uptake protein [Halorubrum sp. SP3]TKX70283.1 TrkA family potassium uptake protein [Halorubrum sp. SP9]SFR44061.1 trk system potassium uptake protein TrkA [Halorubrum sodomense]